MGVWLGDKGQVGFEAAEIWRAALSCGAEEHWGGKAWQTVERPGEGTEGTCFSVFCSDSFETVEPARKGICYSASSSELMKLLLSKNSISRPRVGSRQRDSCIWEDWPFPWAVSKVNRFATFPFLMHALEAHICGNCAFHSSWSLGCPVDQS